MEILTILALRQSGIGNPLHVQLINILREFGYGMELHEWGIKNNVGATYNKENCTITVEGDEEFSFYCSLLVHKNK